MASGPVEGDMSLAVVNPSKGELVVRRVGGDEIYKMTSLPSATASLVQAQKKEILKRLELETVLTNLILASDLLFLAFMATAGTGNLNGRISRRQSRLLELCGDCEVTMDVLKDASIGVQGKLRDAFLDLLEAKEKQAIRSLGRCVTYAANMSDKCKKLADDFKSLRNETEDDKVTALEKLGDQNTKMAELKAKHNEMEAEKSREAAMVVVTNRSIQELEQKIAKEEAAEELAGKREYALQIIGLLAGAASAALGAYLKVKTRGLVGGASSTEKADAESDGPTTAEALAKKVDAVAKAKERLDAEEEEKNAREKKAAVEAQVFQAEIEKTMKQTKLDEAKSVDAVELARTTFNASATELEKLKEELEKVELRLKNARSEKELAIAASESAAAALKSVQDSVKQMAEGLTERMKNLATSRLELVDLKMRREDQLRKSLGELAFLTNSLASNVEEAKVGDAAAEALQVAQWALTNVEVSLNTAKCFWDSMQSFCEKLKDPKALQEIQDQIEDGNTKEERIEYYKSDRFVPVAVTYICQWTALISVCGDYAVASAGAKKSVEDHMRQSPSADQAKVLIGPLEARLNVKQEAGIIASVSRKVDLQAQKEHLRNEISKISATA